MVNLTFDSLSERRQIGGFLRPHLPSSLARGRFILGAILPGYSDVSLPINALPAVADGLNQHGANLMSGLILGERAAALGLIVTSHALAALNGYMARVQ